MKRLKTIAKNAVENRNVAIFEFGQGLKIRTVSDKSKAKEIIKEIVTTEFKTSLNIEFMIQALEMLTDFEWIITSAHGTNKIKSGNFRYYFMPLAIKE